MFRVSRFRKISWILCMAVSRKIRRNFVEITVYHYIIIYRGWNFRETTYTRYSRNLTKTRNAKHAYSVERPLDVGILFDISNIFNIFVVKFTTRGVFKGRHEACTPPPIHGILYFFYYWEYINLHRPSYLFTRTGTGWHIIISWYDIIDILRRKVPTR